MADPTQTLRERLRAALICEDDDNDTPERARVRKSLSAVLDHLRDIGIERELRADLHQLYCSLEDVSVGRNSDLLKPTTMQDGTPKKPSFITSQDAMAAAAVSMLKDDGWTLDNALSFVARPLQLDKRSLRDFRKNLTSKKSIGTPRREEYDYWMTERAKAAGLSTVGIVNDMLKIGKSLQPGR